MDYLLLVSAFFIGSLVSFFLIPTIVKIAHLKSLMDEPGGRKAHVNPIPPMGGLAIMLGTLASTMLMTQVEIDPRFLIVVFSAITFMMIGLGDDLIAMSARRKGFFQFIMICVVVWSGVRIESLFGLLGITDLPVIVQLGLTIVFITGLTNAYNLIDGIDGLAAGIGIIASIALGIAFLLVGSMSFALLSFGLAGGLMGFLGHNFNPAKIFMGDTGSLPVGFLLAVLSVEFLKISHGLGMMTGMHNFGPVILFALLAVPVMDTLQVMIGRMIRGRSPFSADRNHIHHLLLACGLSVMYATLALYTYTLGLVGLVLAGFFMGISNQTILVIIFFFALASVIGLHGYRSYRRRKYLEALAEPAAAPHVKMIHMKKVKGKAS
ncbi:MraY family glycosyltransferase [Pontibacter sp. G13]|uniref:glycosyltransferase family 4 protein n=1 Tax=Pontibacter sp. G13 TaxID=3074898 RepID=UPI002889AA56|nr:MraY family glycosyltransferase [Pontibacter sp. G13]WNJ18921.1 MraY family glycosyltransferase [Pontibacter sp. G13]